MPRNISIVAHIGIIEVGDQLLVIVEWRRIDGSEACHDHDRTVAPQTRYTDLSRKLPACAIVFDQRLVSWNGVGDQVD